MYEIATIGAVTPTRPSVPQPVVMSGLSSLQPYMTKPAMVAAAAGLVAGLVLGALVFGGRRG